MSIEFIPSPNSVLNNLLSPDEYIVALTQDKLLLVEWSDGSRHLPTGTDLMPAGLPHSRLKVGLLDGKLCSLMTLPEDYQPSTSQVLMELRPARILLEVAEDTAVCRAREIAFWRKNHQFCGKCGGKLVDHETECARWCPACNSFFYPVLAPAIIVAITDSQGRLLLAHNAKFREGLFALISGFVEAGESLEIAVRREIQEEVGIKVKNLGYFGSQSWPYPNSLMMGFTAEYAAGDIVPDGVEITEARFFSADALPEIPPPGSIARRLIDYWKSQQKDKTNE